MWTGGISRATGIRSPDRPARSQSLYRMSYPAIKILLVTCEILHINVNVFVIAPDTSKLRRVTYKCNQLTQKPPKPPLHFHAFLSTPAMLGIPRATIYRACRHSVCCRQCSQWREMETPSNLLAHFPLGTIRDSEPASCWVSGFHTVARDTGRGLKRRHGSTVNSKSVHHSQYLI